MRLAKADASCVEDFEKTPLIIVWPNIQTPRITNRPTIRTFLGSSCAIGMYTNRIKSRQTANQAILPITFSFLFVPHNDLSDLGPR